MYFEVLSFSAYTFRIVTFFKWIGFFIIMEYSSLFLISFCLQESTLLNINIAFPAFKNVLWSIPYILLTYLYHHI